MTEVVLKNQSGESLGASVVGGELIVQLGVEIVFSHLELSGAAAEVMADFNRLISDLDRLRSLEASVRRKAEMIKGRWWDVSDETGVGGELHAAITELLLELEGESEARQVAEAKALA
ncbi:hypothetical protein [Pseudomonas sp. CM27]|uniref:hypothetical protein n=1 Tax=Pseudomonas sp. CM27 TaxID=2738452 RepID=UPI0015516AC4|nr:hypothetical protein [Pseudomonas sp. CM27]NQD77013.1 hypothetical protein [Pseudomonas sp. CM27]